MSARQFHLTIIAFVALAYMTVRIGIAPESGWLRFHTTDFLAGVALPSVIALAFDDVSVSRLPGTLGGKLALTAGAVVVWGGIVPLVSERSTADWRDVIAYFAGTAVQHVVQAAAFSAPKVAVND